MGTRYEPQTGLRDFRMGLDLWYLDAEDRSLAISVRNYIHNNNHHHNNNNNNNNNTVRMQE